MQDDADIEQLEPGDGEGEGQWDQDEGGDSVEQELLGVKKGRKGHRGDQKRNQPENRSE